MTVRSGLRGFLAAVAVATALAPGVASAQESQDSELPGRGRLIAAGIGMAVPTYLVGVVLHEGSHAGMARLVGAEIVDFSLIPGRHPRNQRFYLGYTEVRGLATPGRKMLFYIAPKLTDAVLFTGYAALLGTDTLPDNRYGQLALAVFATGLWVDFSKDILPLSEAHDTARFYTLAGWRSEWSRLPARIAHGALSLAGAWLLYRGYQRVFASAGESAASAGEPAIVPVLRGQF